MTPLQVQFCYNIAHGNAADAQNLLPQMLEEHDILAENEWGCSPASFCLWAARQPDRLQVLNKLQEFFPDIEFNAQQIAIASGTIEDAVRQVIVPILIPSLLNLLLQIVTRVAPHDFDQHDAKKRFDLDACATALAFILADPAFKDIEEAKRDITNKLWIKLRPFVSGDAPSPLIQPAEDQTWTPPTQAPASVKKVREAIPTKPAPRSMNFMYPGMVRPALEPSDVGDENENTYTPTRKASGFLPSGGPAYYRNQGSNVPNLDMQKPRIPQSLRAVLATQASAEPSVDRSSSILSRILTPWRLKH